MKTLTTKNDFIELSNLNAQFIKNFMMQDVAAHDRIIHKDFVCIQGSGAIVDRDTYLSGWKSSFKSSGYTSFDYTDESIRIFGNMALVSAKTVYTKVIDGETLNGNSIYTDVYVKEDGKWSCVQAQITPVK